MANAPRTVADINSFITMLLTACEDQSINQKLEHVLSMPDQKRQAVIRQWISDMLVARAPSDFIQAVACLLDDRVAEKAWEVIYKCRRGERI